MQEERTLRFEDHEFTEALLAYSQSKGLEIPFNEETTEVKVRIIEDKNGLITAILCWAPREKFVGE